MFEFGLKSSVDMDKLYVDDGKFVIWQYLIYYAICFDNQINNGWNSKYGISRWIFLEIYFLTICFISFFNILFLIFKSVIQFWLFLVISLRHDFLPVLFVFLFSFDAFLILSAFSIFNQPFFPGLFLRSWIGSHLFIYFKHAACNSAFCGFVGINDGRSQGVQ